METGPEQFTDTQQTWARVYLSLVVTFLMTSMSDRNIIIWGSEGTDGASYLWDWPGIVGVRRAAVDVRLSQQWMTFLSFFLKVATFSFTTIGCKLRTRLLLFFWRMGGSGGWGLQEMCWRTLSPIWHGFQLGCSLKKLNEGPVLTHSFCEINHFANFSSLYIAIIS